MDFLKRNTEPELMDNPDIDGVELRKVLKDINRANRLLGGNSVTINALKSLIDDHSQNEYVILDVGCGDGEMLRQIAKFFRERKIRVKLIGVDLNEQALEIGREQSVQFPEIQFRQQDILAMNGEQLACDFLLCTLTMHHFGDRQIPVFLEKFVKLTSIAVVINDLQRSRLAYYLFKVFSVIFIRTETAKHDGLISIQSGFLKRELLNFSKQLSTVRHKIKWKWAFRYVWVMEHARLSRVNE